MKTILRLLFAAACSVCCGSDATRAKNASFGSMRDSQTARVEHRIMGSYHGQGPTFFATIQRKDDAWILEVTMEAARKKIIDRKRAKLTTHEIAEWDKVVIEKVYGPDDVRLSGVSHTIIKWPNGEIQEMERSGDDARLWNLLRRYLER